MMNYEYTGDVDWIAVLGERRVLFFSSLFFPPRHRLRESKYADRFRESGWSWFGMMDFHSLLQMGVSAKETVHLDCG